MAYDPLSFEDFARRLRSGRYRNLRASRQAIGSSGWALVERDKARTLAAEHFGRHGSSEPAAADVLSTAAPFDGDLEAALSDFQGYVAAGKLSPIIKAIVLATRDELRLRIGRLSEPGAVTIPAGPKRATPRPPSPPLPEATTELPVHDLSKLMDGPVDDPGEDDEEEDAAGHQNGTSVDISPEDVARMMTPRADLDVGIAEMEAAAVTEKDKAAAREFGRLVREQVAKGAFSKK